MPKTEREYVFTNSAAQKHSQEELLDRLKECFVVAYQREPLADEIKGLHEAAECIRANNIAWRTFERGIRDETWDPRYGARSVLGAG